ncbi:MAG: T9SS C-terminal target domain-containing protein, partial [Bacteroidetes bacterium]
TISRILDDGFYVSFHEYVAGLRKVEVQKYSLNFKPLGNFIHVSDAKHSSWQTEPIVSTNKNGYSLVVWNDKRNGRSDIYGRVLDENYEPVGDDFIINYFPVASNIKDKGAIPLSDGSFAVAYLNSASWANNKAYLQRISESGGKSGGMIYIGEVSLNDFKISLNENNGEIVITAYGDSPGSIKWWKYNYESESLTDKKIFPMSSYKAIDVSINEQLKTFVVWASADSSQNMKIFGKVYDEKGNVYIDTLNYFTSGNSNGYIDYLTSSIDNKDNITLLWSENYALNFYRKSKRTNDNYYQKIYVSSIAPPQIVFAKNNKLFFTYSARETIYYKYLNENKFEEKDGTLITLPSLISSSLRYYAKNSSSIFDNRLLVAFESNINGATGYDIWGKAFAVDFADTSKEFYYENLHDDVLYPVYPNPVNSIANLSYWVYSYHHVNISVYDVLGRKVKELVNGTKEEGIYEINFDVSDLSSGVYS